MATSRSIKGKIDNLPQKPGVYVFHNANGKSLYVGRAKNLRSRVRSYFAFDQKETSPLASGARGQASLTRGGMTPAKQLMVNQTTNIDYTVVDTETEALLLETNLIKKHKPPYNVMLRDDKDWQYIKIDYSTPWTQIYYVRRPQVKKVSKAKFFGPYTSGLAVKEALRQIKKLFPICLSPPYEGGVKNPSRSPLIKGRRRACFNYHLNRCLGPCVGETTPMQYAKVFNDIMAFLKGDYRKLISGLESKMQAASQSKNFEVAAKTRNILLALKKLNQRQKVVLNLSGNIDLVSLHREIDTAAINLFKIRQGKLVGKFNSLAKNIESQDDEEILESFIERYYQATTDLPTQVITNFKLSTKIPGLKFAQAQRGKKAQLLKLGAHNAYEYFKRQTNFFDRIKKREAALKELQKLFKLKDLPNRIEAYDIANIQGVSAVGGMVAFENGQAKKSEYRKFSIKTIKGANDPAMMTEVLSRRLRHKSWPKPDLIVLDGGKPQLNAIIKVIKLSNSVPVIALAKREEDIYISGRLRPIKLPQRSRVLQLLQTMRDEVHRYANSFFQKKHTRKTFKSSLDNIPGIGPKTKKLLKQKYGSVEKIKKAPRQKLENLIGPHRAKAIYGYLETNY